MNSSKRLIFCAPKHCHITPLLLRLHCLPIRLRIQFKILLITFKVLQGSAPKYLTDLISVLPPSRYDLRRNNTGILLSTPKCFQRVTTGDRSFMAAAPRLWNNLPVDIRSACTISDFKQNLYLVKHFVSIGNHTVLSFRTKYLSLLYMTSLAYKISHFLAANRNPEIRCVICTGVTLFALVLHFNCTALSRSESSNFL